MQSIVLKQTDLKVSRLSFGTMPFGSQADEMASTRMVEYCLDSGINFFDTANMYNMGLAEEVLGKALKGKRHRVVLASKVRWKMGEAPDQQGLSRPAILRAVDESLRRLQTDYLDLYYLHMPDWDVRIEETLGAMDELVKQGKVRYPAASNYAGWQIVQMRWIADRNGYKPVSVTQPMYSLIARGIEQEYLPMCKEFDIATLVYNPLAGGLLTGKHKQEAPIAGTRFDKNKLYLDRYWHMQDFEAVEELRSIAAKDGRSLISLALNWILHHTPVDGVIIGASRLEQLKENLAVLNDGPVSPDALAACDAIWRRLRGVTPKYNR